MGNVVLFSTPTDYIKGPPSLSGLGHLQPSRAHRLCHSSISCLPPGSFSDLKTCFELPRLSLLACLGPALCRLSAHISLPLKSTLLESAACIPYLNLPLLRWLLTLQSSPQRIFHTGSSTSSVFHPGDVPAPFPGGPLFHGSGEAPELLGLEAPQVKQELGPRTDEMQVSG